MEKIIEAKICGNCKKSFNVYEKDKEFYEKINVPTPAFCPECRRQRRQTFRNERTLYNRKCSLTGKPTISVYSESAPFPVYDHEAWHGDKWDALSFGQDFDFTRPFFDQFQDLYKKVPRISLMNQISDNSDYCNYAYSNRNCYLTFGSHYNENVLYCNYVWKGVNCLDCIEVIQSELIYEGIYSTECYQCAFVEYCFNCSECYFCYDMIGCKNCAFSSNLRNKQYYIFNKPYSKEDYEKYIKDMDMSEHESLQALYGKYKEIRKEAMKRNMYQKSCEHCFGSDIQHSKNVFMGFNTKYAEDSRYLDTQATHVTDSMDLTCIGYDPSEILYECVGNLGAHHNLFCNSCWNNSDVFYCEQCFNNHDVFGCVGLRHKQYCVLNKQYSQEEYEKLLPRIIEHMKKSGEWGEFFPSRISEFCYNETVAQIYFPLTQEEATEKGYKWKQKEPKEYQVQKTKVANSLNDVEDSILNEILACEECGRNYKIVPAELNFYRRMGIALPRRCQDCRHKERVSLKTPRTLYERKCNKCGELMMTNYAPDKPDTVYCEKCYLETVI